MNIILRIFLIVVTANMLNGCAAYYGTDEANLHPEPEFEYGFIAYHITSEYTPKREDDRFASVDFQFHQIGELFSDIRAFQRAPSELKIYYAKTGKYQGLTYRRGRDTYLRDGMDYAGFEVRPGEVTYLGDFHFVFDQNWYAGFDLNVVNNIQEREQQIKNYLSDIDSVKYSDAIVNAPDIGENFLYKTK